MKRLILFGAAVAMLIGVAAGCEKKKEKTGIRVMTWNVYVGADLNVILEETDPEMIPIRVAQAWAEAQSTDFEERAEALADEIVRENPHLVGLQEVSTVYMQSPGDFLYGNPVQATDEELNFLDILIDELEERGASYSPVVISKGFDIEMPLAVSLTQLDDIRLVDHEVLLARDDVQIGNTVAGHYETNLEIPFPGATITLQMGWVSADVEIDDQEFHFVSTHLETAGPTPYNPESWQALVQIVQATELIYNLSTVQLPIILVGDFNSDADGSTTLTYSNLLTAGFEDAWVEAGVTGTAHTCCQLSHLLNTTSELDRRIDYILFSDEFQVSSIKRVGADPEDRTTSVLWPSDHAGLSAIMRLP